MRPDADPFEMIERMFQGMSRQFDQAPAPMGGRFGASQRGTMGVDVLDHGDAYEVTADLPGFEPEDVDLRVTPHAVHIAATHRESGEKRAESSLRSERSQRSVAEQVRLPDPVDENAVEATLHNGVLTVELPKAASRGGHTIDLE